jgi:hypothetical protein
VTFAECIIRQEVKTGKMVFPSCTEFTNKFTLIFCPENEVTTTLMTLKSNWYFQGKRNMDTYTNEFRELVTLSGYIDPIACFAEVSTPPLRTKSQSLAQID